MKDLSEETTDSSSGTLLTPINEGSSKCCNCCRKTIGIILIIFAIILGFYISSAAMMGAAGSSKSPFVGFLVQLLISFAITCGVSFLGLLVTRFLYPYKLKALYFSLIIFGVCYIITLSLYLAMFYKKVANMTEYTNIPSGHWNLSTGSRIAYYEYGADAKEKYPFMIIHGGPGAPVLGKEHFVDELAKLGYKSYQYDQLGGGRSSRLKDCTKYTLARQVDDLEEIRKTLNVEKINIICHSFGGTLSSNYIAKYPNRVDNCIFISPGSIWSGDKSVIKLTTEGSKDQQKILMKNTRYFLSQALSMMFPPKGLSVMMKEKDLDNLFIQFHDGLNMQPGSGKFYNTKGAGYGFWVNVMTGRDSNKMESPYEKLADFTGKSLVVKGQFDYISFDVTVQYRDLIPNSLLITIDGMGHSIVHEHEEEIWQNIEAFLKTGKPIKHPYTGDHDPWQ